MAIAAALAQPWAWRVLSGAVTGGQVRSNVRGAALVLAGDQLAELADFAVGPVRYWHDRAQRAWA
ncbi:MAG: hypothetical protein ACRCYQ_15675 [Nocardioides sp.]